MKKELTVETVELEQCPRERNSKATLRDPYPGPPPFAEPSSRLSEGEEHRRLAMASSTDAAFVEDADVDRELRARARGASKSHKSGATSPGPDSDTEDAPLLNTSRDGYGSSGGDSDDNEEGQWDGDADFRGLPWWKRPSIYWLLPPFLLFTIAFGGIIVPKINLIMDLVCVEYYATLETDPISSPMDPGQDRCQNDAVSSRSSLFLLYAGLCSGLLSAIVSPKIGALSDRYGRKSFMVANTFGALFGEIITILAAKFPETVHVNWILVGYALEGISGSFIVGMACAHSYASDVTAPQKRNVAFSYFHACLFGGIAIGPILSGYIINAREKYVGKTEAVLLIFYIALGAHLFFIAFLTFLVPESLSKAKQEAAREKYREDMERDGPSADWINQLRSINFVRPLKILWPTGPGTSSAVRWNLVLLAATDTIMFGVAMGAMSVVLIYTRRQFEWHELESGRFTTIVNISRVFALLVILPLLTRIFRGKNGAARLRSTGSDLFDLSIIRAAIFFDMLGYLGYALVRNGELFALSGTIAAIGGIGSPTLGAALTKHVPQDQVGQLLGATGLLHAVARVVGPTIFNGIYSATVASYRQTVFVCLAATFGLAFLCSWFIRPHIYIDEEKKRSMQAQEQDA
ncbi:tetracycline-efflux transporter [Stemphylium lycopersici]|uniref:Tetracycline-efflux transporter n=1 Tax=Stemphylium lycopersici TaxID=183478 RepID=A0A364MTY8_STELY|nr:tetracycline-efflux transporter [Stemphylium lycopersici]RAR03526.1 tetracycline-efflux transporter [Stemphylium lycopersici]